MPTVKIRTGERKFANVHVTRPECPSYDCCYYAREHHTSPAEYSGRSAWTGDGLVCKRNERYGCPREKVVTDPPERRRIPWVDGGWEGVE